MDHAALWRERLCRTCVLVSAAPERGVSVFCARCDHTLIACVRRPGRCSCSTTTSRCAPR